MFNMAQSDKIKILVDYLVETVSEDGSALELTAETFAELTKTTSTQAFQVFKYSVIASMDLPDNIVMEVRNTLDGKAKSRVKMPYVFKKVQNFDEYEINERNFRHLDSKDIHDIAEAFSDRPDLSKKTVMIIMYIVDLLAIKNFKKVWIRLREDYLPTIFMIPKNVIEQYLNVLIEKGIITVKEHPYDKKPVLKLNLVCAFNPEITDEVGECVAIGYSIYKKNTLTQQLNANVSKKMFDNIAENAIIKNIETANVYRENNGQHYFCGSVDDALNALHNAIANEMQSLKTENEGLKKKASDYDTSSKAFQALNEQYQEISMENDRYKEEYISPAKFKAIKKNLKEKIATILNKYSSDMSDKFDAAQSGENIYGLKREVLTMTLDALTSVDRYIDSAEKFAEKTNQKDEELDKGQDSGNENNSIA